MRLSVPISIRISAINIATRLFGAIICLFATVLTGCNIPPHFGETPSFPASSYYPLAVGDHWTYAFGPAGKKFNADITDKRVFNGVTTYAYSIDNVYSYMAVTAQGVTQFAQADPDHPDNATVFSPPELIYKFPFRVGDDWSTPVLIETGKGKSDLVGLYGRVESIDDLTVPAGTFHQCVHLVVDDPRDTPANLTELWFAPNVGIIQTKTAISRSAGLKPKIYYTELVSYNLK